MAPGTDRAPVESSARTPPGCGPDGAWHSPWCESIPVRPAAAGGPLGSRVPMRPNRRPKKRETWTIYEGDSTTVAKEFLYNAQNPGGTPSETKNYAYDPSGNLIALSDSQGSTTNRYTTVTNPQSSVSLLLNQSGSPVQSYGYSAYGQANSTLTQNGSLSANLNPYRFQSKRLDGGFNTYDMGARRYSLTTSRWQQQDQYYDADQDWASRDATTADGTSLRGGNPVNYVEADGHEPWCQTAAKCAIVGVLEATSRARSLNRKGSWTEETARQTT